jgi:hypothetical protein
MLAVPRMDIDHQGASVDDYRACKSISTIIKNLKLQTSTIPR